MPHLQKVRKFADLLFAFANLLCNVFADLRSVKSANHKKDWVQNRKSVPHLQKVRKFADLLFAFANLLFAFANLLFAESICGPPTFKDSLA